MTLDKELRKQLAEKRREAEDRGKKCTWMIRKGKLVNQLRVQENR